MRTRPEVGSSFGRDDGRNPSWPSSASSVNATTFKLFKVNSDGTQTRITDVVVSLSRTGLKATLNPFGAKTTLLARNTKYKGVVSTGTKDLAGNSLGQQKSWTFTTNP